MMCRYHTVGLKNLIAITIVTFMYTNQISSFTATNDSSKVDISADPPRSIWTHPYEDEQYLREHPDVQQKVGKGKNFAGELEPAGNRASYHGESSTRNQNRQSDVSLSNTAQKSGFFAKLKDKAFGSKEERALKAAQRQEVIIYRPFQTG